MAPRGGAATRRIFQVAEDPELRMLVDDFFFEMHLCHDVMRMHKMSCAPRRAKNGKGPPKAALPPMSTWYDVAVPARAKGLRMHYWP